MHGAERIDDVAACIAVMNRCRDQVEAMLRHFRVLDMQGEGLGYLLQRERNGHDPPTDGDEEARPGRCERLVGGDGAEQALRWK